MLLLMKNKLIIFRDATSSSEKRKEKQKLIVNVDFATKINTMYIIIKMINAPRLNL